MRIVSFFFFFSFLFSRARNTWLQQFHAHVCPYTLASLARFELLVSFLL
jgi:hypothetical protein